MFENNHKNKYSTPILLIFRIINLIYLISKLCLDIKLMVSILKIYYHKYNQYQYIELMKVHYIREIIFRLELL